MYKCNLSTIISVSNRFKKFIHFLIEKSKHHCLDFYLGVPWNLTRIS